jgi:cyclase
VRIFNEREVDEIVILDINASPAQSEPQYDLIEEIAAEAFMPFAYGGAIRSIDQAREIFRRGAEKVVVNTAAHQNPELIRELADEFGSQSVVVSIDCKRKWLGQYQVVTKQGRTNTRKKPEGWAIEVERLGAGEILLTSVDRDGLFSGYDIELTSKVVSSVDIPVIACGGAGKLEHIRDVVRESGASAGAAGSLFVFQGPHRAVLINYPEREILDQLFD